jgi:hypothetical protein
LQRPRAEKKAAIVNRVFTAPVHARDPNNEIETSAEATSIYESITRGRSQQRGRLDA